MLSGRRGLEVLPASIGSDAELRAVDEAADLVLLPRDALGAGPPARFSRPERLRPWTYEFDPSGLELLRRAVERVQSARRDAAGAHERGTGTRQAISGRSA